MGCLAHIRIKSGDTGARFPSSVKCLCVRGGGVSCVVILQSPIRSRGRLPESRWGWVLQIKFPCQHTPATGIPSSSRCGRHRVQSDADRILCCAGILAGGLDSVPRGKEVPISVGSGTSCGSGGVQESLLRFMITSCSSFGTLTTAQTSSV